MRDLLCWFLIEQKIFKINIWYNPFKNLCFRVTPFYNDAENLLKIENCKTGSVFGANFRHETTLWSKIVARARSQSHHMNKSLGESFVWNRIWLVLDQLLPLIISEISFKARFFNVFIGKTTNYGRPERKKPTLHSRKFTPTPKFLGTAEAYFVATSAQLFRYLWFMASLGESVWYEMTKQINLIFKIVIKILNLREKIAHFLTEESREKEAWRPTHFS